MDKQTNKLLRIPFPRQYLDPRRIISYTAAINSHETEYHFSY